MKAVVLGIDGATFDLIRPLAEKGELPAFARLLREGSWGTLRSTIPPESPSAWTSFATGLNPGRHGVYGFMIRRQNTYDYAIGSSRAVCGTAFWEIAGKQGLRVGVINVPFTYPPRPVNGFVVAGMMTPDLRSPFTHPPELRDLLLREIPGYSPTHGLGRTQRGDARSKLVAAFAPAIATRERAMRWLAERYRPDLLVCVFTILDRLQHFLWAEMDPGHPAHDPAAGTEFREAIVEGYRLIDAVVGRTVEWAGEDAAVFILSDHGFEAVSRTFYVNAWLSQVGLLVPTGRPEDPSPLKRGIARWARPLRAAPLGDGFRERFRARHLLSDAFVRAIDWRRTRAWFGLDRGLWLNVAGRDPFGLIEPGSEYERLRSEIIAGLRALRDPETGRPVVAAVHRREEIYQGEHLSRAPDLVVEPARTPTDPAGRYILSERLGSGWLVGPSAPISGHHTPEGVLIAWGRGIVRACRLEGVSIVDVAPSILCAIGVSGGESMEGKVPARLFGEPVPKPAVPAAAVETAVDSSATPQADERERRAVEERLRNLGYLD